MKLFTKAAAAGFVLLLIAAVVLTAGCVQDETGNPDTSVMPIVGEWTRTFTSDSGVETTMTYHFNSDNTGFLSTGKTTNSIHWAYITEKKVYMIHYDKLQQQEDMIIVQEDDKRFLYSLGRGDRYERV